jgi:hypothetical protein
MKKMNFLLLIMIIISYDSKATIKRVPTYFSSIQIAIDNSASGDTVIIDNGIYKENINLKGKNLVVASKFLLTNDTSAISKTIIDGQQNGSVVTITNNENNTAQICGLSIKNGKSGNGGGISIGQSSKPIISYCNIYDNIAAVGGGISILSNSKPIIKNCKIFNNHTNTTDDLSTHGGGVIAGNYTEARLISCEIFNNSSTYYGGGIYAISNPIVNLYKFSLSIERCLIYGNNAQIGGGVASFHGCNIKIVNSTILDNHATSGSELFLYDGNSTVVNSIICNYNFASVNSIHFEQPTCCTMSSQSQLYIDYSLIFGGLNSIKKVGEKARLYYNEHNIELDPLFADTCKKDFKLKENSPCINKGISRFLIPADGIYVGDTLVDFNSTDFNGDAPDLGAWEFLNEASIPNNVIKGLVMFINPENGCISIKSPNIIIRRFELYNLEGQIVGGDKVNRNEFDFNITSLKQGYYLMKIKMLDSVIVKKFLKK